MWEKIPKVEFHSMLNLGATGSQFRKFRVFELSHVQRRKG